MQQTHAKNACRNAALTLHKKKLLKFCISVIQWWKIQAFCGPEIHFGNFSKTSFVICNLKQ